MDLFVFVTFFGGFLGLIDRPPSLQAGRRK
jgi:hypothetical protein